MRVRVDAGCEALEDRGSEGAYPYTLSARWWWSVVKSGQGKAKARLGCLRTESVLHRTAPNADRRGESPPAEIGGARWKRPRSIVDRST
jgi:hypothetical protein